MQSRVITRSSPQVYRIVKAVPSPSCTRTMSLFPRSLPFGGSFAPPMLNSAIDREIAPFFRMMDDLSRNFEGSFFPFLPVSTNTAPRPAAPAPYTPRFDVREVDGAYELRGELPGVEASNLQVEFTDPHTLTIRGRTESETSSGTPSRQLDTQQAVGAAGTITTESTSIDGSSATANPVDATPVNATAVTDSDASSTPSTSQYRKASVEDEGAPIAPESSPEVSADNNDGASTPGQATPSESIAPEATPQQLNAVTDNTPAPRYWVSERRTGSFQRSFTFPGQINQEGVTASLKNGVLSVVVPKARQRAMRRIVVL